MPSYANFTSRCGVCQSPIEEGEPIEKLDDEWVHEACYLDEAGDDFEPVLDEDEL